MKKSRLMYIFAIAISVAMSIFLILMTIWESNKTYPVFAGCSIAQLLFLLIAPVFEKNGQ